MTLHTSTSRIARRSTIAAALIAGVALLGAAAPANASHCAPAPKFALRIDLNGGSLSCAPVHRVEYKPVVNLARIEYERGLDNGRAAGFSEGFRDGAGGNSYCANAVVPCDESRSFRDGFLAAYGRGYSDGFERGRCERNERLARVARFERFHHHGHIVCR